MSSPAKRSLQTRGSNNPTRNALHPPRGARSAVAWRALSGAPTRPPVGPAGRDAAGRVRSPGGSGRAVGRARRPRIRVAVPLTTTAAGIVAPRRSPRPPAPPAHLRWSSSARGPVVLHRAFVGTVRTGKCGGTRCGVGPHGEGQALLQHGASAACLTLRIADACTPKGPLQT